MVDNVTASGETEAIKQAWRQYHATIDAMREELYASSAYRWSNAGQVNHYLSQIQAFAYHMVIAPRQNHPIILGPTFFQAHSFKMGMQSPYFLYRAIFLDGSRSYRLHGTRGKTLFHQILVLRGGYNDPAPTEVCEHLMDEFVQADGSFDVIVGGEKRDKNWIELDRESKNNWIFMRECCHDWASCEEVDEVDIELVGDFDPSSGMPDEAEVIKRLAGAERLIRILHKTASWPHVEHNNVARTGPNVFSPLVVPKAAAYNPVAVYLYSMFDLADDEALLIECDPPESYRYWDISTCDIWGQNNDFIYHQASLSSFQSVSDADGKIRLVVCKCDPGVPNWLDTVGLSAGALMWRWYWGNRMASPQTRVVKLADLRQHLPAATGQVGKDERQAELRQRRRAVLRRYRNLL